MSRYSQGAIILHWLMAVMIIGNLAGGLLHDFVPTEGGQRLFVMNMHKSFGFTILALTLVRIGWRLANKPPALPAYFTSGERVLAKGTHAAIYVAMFALPLSGWIMADRNARGQSWFGLFEVPKFGVGKPVAEIFHEAHEILGWTMLALVVLHVAGIFKHLWLDRDNLLPRMGVGTARRT